MKSTTNILLLALLILILQGHTLCQAQQTDTVGIKEMKKLKDLQGTWSGSGWYQRGAGPKYEINQTEQVVPKLNSQVLVIDGQGKDPETSDVVFEAFAVINYSPEKGEYQLSAYTKDGHTIASAKFEGEDFVWWFQTPTGGTVKYIINFTADKWVEDGHFSPDGKQWYPFFHMELKKL